MFVNCPYCRTLVATDPATDRPPAHCPECLGPLRAGPAANVPLAEAELSEGGETVAAAATLAPAEETRASADPSAVDAAVGDAVEEDAVEDTHETSGATTSPTASAAPVADTTQAAEASAAPAAAIARTPGYGRRAGSRSAAPSFVRQHATAPASGRGWPEAAAVVALTLLLGLQCLLADRARLAADARWRGVLEPLCATLGCDLPPWREPTAFVLLQRDVRQHPSLPGTLRVTASFRNDARWAQPWPQLELTLSDANGRPAGRRRFPATDYLGGSPTQPMLASGDTASVTMDILEPAPQIVAYDFRFR